MSGETVRPATVKEFRADLDRLRIYTYREGRTLYAFFVGCGGHQASLRFRKAQEDGWWLLFEDGSDFPIFCAPRFTQKMREFLSDNFGLIGL